MSIMVSAEEALRWNNHLTATRNQGPCHNWICTSPEKVSKVRELLLKGTGLNKIRIEVHVGMKLIRNTRNQMCKEGLL